MNSSFIAIFEAIGLLIGFGAFLFVVVVITKYIGGKANKSMRSRHINIVETVSIGLDKQLHLIRVGEQFLLIASSGKNIEFLSNIKLDEFNVEGSPENNTIFDFKNMFEKYLQNFSRKKENGFEKNVNSKDSGGTSEGERIKSNLNRLRTINTGVEKQSKENEDG